jgi:hypothetical protein
VDKRAARVMVDFRQRLEPAERLFLTRARWYGGWTAIDPSRKFKGHLRETHRLFGATEPLDHAGATGAGAVKAMVIWWFSEAKLEQDKTLGR